jgi:anti-sigma B factor antagonist
VKLIITESAAGEIAVIKVKGDLDVYTAPELRRSLMHCDAEGFSLFLLDLTECTYLDATGLGVLVGTLKRARARGGSVAIACDSEPILKIFRTTGLTKVFAIHATVADAVAALTDPGCPS